MTSDGFAAPNFPIGGGPPSNLGNPQFPNLPVIEATHDLGLFTGGGVPFFDPQSGMSAPERQAWQRRIMHCFQATQRQDPLFGSGQFNQLGSGWFNIVNQVSQSPQIRALSKTAAACSAALVGDEPLRTIAGSDRTAFIVEHEQRRGTGDTGEGSQNPGDLLGEGDQRDHVAAERSPLHVPGPDSDGVGGRARAAC